MVYESTTLNNLFDMAVEATRDVVPGETYIVRDLFRGFEWNRIQKGNRTKLGAMYFSYAKTEAPSEIESLGKTPQNQQMYRKKQVINII